MWSFENNIQYHLTSNIAYLIFVFEKSVEALKTFIREYLLIWYSHF
jgi:hypothetical protein